MAPLLAIGVASSCCRDTVIHKGAMSRVGGGGKMFFKELLCYDTPYEEKWLREEDLL
jgi:hypothetical protein